MFIVGFVGGCFQIIAWMNCVKEERKLFTIEWIVNSDIYNEKGNKYRKLYIANMVLITVLFAVFITTIDF